LSNSTRNRVAGALIAGLMALSPLLAADTAQLDLNQYHGKIVMLDFWASWCVPCRRSFPWMNTMQEKYGDDGLVIIAVNVDNEAADAAAFLQKYPAKFEVVYDKDRQLVRDYAIEAMPSSFLIGRDGNVIDNHLGFKTIKTEEYEAAIVAALGE
jgi:cytochrome c biogenesis protein CcmG/thiol:disulfide interchange protein DsbE